MTRFAAHYGFTPSVAPAAAPAELSNTGFNLQVTSLIAAALLAATGFVFTRRSSVRE